MGRILLVDDDRGFSAALARRLAQEGYQTCIAGGAASALKHFTEQETIDLVIADLQLCRESGLDLCSQLRQEHPGLPVILLSASPDTTSYLEAMRCGAYEYLAKPLDFGELRGVLQRALNPAGRNP